MASELTGTSFVVRKKIMTVGGAKFEIFDAQEKMILFSGEKVFTIKEDIRVYSDESGAKSASTSRRAPSSASTSCTTSSTRRPHRNLARCGTRASRCVISGTCSTPM